MIIDLRKIPSYVISRIGVPAQLTQYSPAVIEAGKSGWPHVTDCTLNHYAALNLGLGFGKFPFLVLEEDAWQTQWYDHQITDVPPCDVLKLDLSTLGRFGEEWSERHCLWHDTRANSVVVINMLSSAAYLVMNGEVASEMLNRLKDGVLMGVPSDVVFLPLMKRHFFAALKKPLFYQGPAETNPNAKYTNWAIE